MKRSYPSETEKIRDKKECGQTPQVLFLLFTQTPQLLVNTVSVPAAPIPGTSFSSLPSTDPENNSVPMHRTILRRGHDPLLSIERCSVCCNMFHCDYCKMLHKHLHEAKNHVANHFRNAVQQEGFVIIKCGLGCRQAPHFHCCYCKSTLIRRDALIKHLTACKNTSHKQPPPKVPALPPPPPPFTAEVPPSQVEEPPSQVEEPPSQVEEPPSQVEEPPSQVEEPSSQVEEPPSQVEEPPSQVEEPSSQVEEPSSQVEEPPSQLPPSPAERPSPTAEDPLSPAEKLPSPPERSPSTAERPTSTAERSPSTAERPPSPPERPPSPPERPPSTAEDPPTPAEGPPSATAASAAMHRTILRRGHDPLLSIERCSVCCNMFHCDYCKMLHKHLHQAQNHVANHVRNAVQHEGFVIIKCGLGCRQAPHFHCCYCKSTLIRKDALIKHLVLCKNTSDVQSPPTVSAAAPPPPPSTEEVPPSLVERPPSQVEEPSSQVPPFSVKVPPFPSAVRLRVRQQVRVACPHCGIQINKKNLMVHIKRRHRHNTLL